VVDLNMACNDDGYEPAGYRRFREAQMRRYGAMDAPAWGTGWGVWCMKGAWWRRLGLFGRDGGSAASSTWRRTRLAPPRPVPRAGARRLRARLAGAAGTRW
jgi:hypothetical protein